MKRIIAFKLTKLQSYVYIFMDKIVAIRNFGDCVRIYTDNTFFDVEETLEEVLTVIKVVQP